MSTDNKVKLKSSDDEIFEMEELVAYELNALKPLFEDTAGTDIPIPLNNVSGKVLSKVVEFCQNHVEAKKNFVPEDVVKQWDAEFIQADPAKYKHLAPHTKAAYELGVEHLVDLAADVIANNIKTKSALEIQSFFNT